jgi:hypothetical protein
LHVLLLLVVLLVVAQGFGFEPPLGQVGKGVGQPGVGHGQTGVGRPLACEVGRVVAGLELHHVALPHAAGQAQLEVHLLGAHGRLVLGSAQLDQGARHDPLDHCHRFIGGGGAATCYRRSGFIFLFLQMNELKKERL